MSDEPIRDRDGDILQSQCFVTIQILVQPVCNSVSPIHEKVKFTREKIIISVQKCIEVELDTLIESTNYSMISSSSLPVSRLPGTCQDAKVRTIPPDWNSTYPLAISKEVCSRKPEWMTRRRVRC